MNSDLYLKFYMTQEQTILNTCLYLGLSELELRYLICAWVITTSSDKEVVFCSADLSKILHPMLPGRKYTHRRFRNVKVQSLEEKGYLEFVYAKTGKGAGERYYKLNFLKVNELMNVLLIFYHEYLKKYKKLVGTFGYNMPKTRSYYKVKRYVVKHINSLRG
jgi:hypothetical protein